MWRHKRWPEANASSLMERLGFIVSPTTCGGMSTKSLPAGTEAPFGEGSRGHLESERRED
ncbi:MAG: hypothetical protein O6939_03410 [Bacteroidetes bacterium]|nr:hypothetical protein [Bacteroidota bacterium]